MAFWLTIRWAQREVAAVLNTWLSNYSQINKANTRRLWALGMLQRAGSQIQKNLLKQALLGWTHNVNAGSTTQKDGLYTLLSKSCAVRMMQRSRKYVTWYWRRSWGCMVHNYEAWKWHDTLQKLKYSSEEILQLRRKLIELQEVS